MSGVYSGVTFVSILSFIGFAAYLIATRDSFI